MTWLGGVPDPAGHAHRQADQPRTSGPLPCDTVSGDAECMPTLTLSRAFLALHGVVPGALQGPVLRRDIAVALRPVLLSYGFDVTGPIAVRQLKGDQGFHLMQPPVSISPAARGPRQG